MRTVMVKVPRMQMGLAPEAITGEVTRETTKIDGQTVELFHARGERPGDRMPEYYWSFHYEPECLLEWSTDPRDVLPVDALPSDTVEGVTENYFTSTLPLCYCGVLVRDYGEPCQHCEAEGVTDYPAAPPVGPPMMTDAEALAAIKRLRRYDDDLRALDANYKALKKATEDKRERFLALEGERLKTWTASKLKGNRRSVRTLEGVAQFRTVPAKVRIVDEALALEWARKYDRVETVERLPPSILKAARWKTTDPETGEEIYDAPVGLEITAEYSTFTVKGTAPTEGDEDDE